MIAWIRTQLAVLWDRIDPGAAPGYAEVYGQQWAEARRARQHAPFVVDPVSLAPHGLAP